MLLRSQENLEDSIVLVCHHIQGAFGLLGCLCDLDRGTTLPPQQNFTTWAPQGVESKLTSPPYPCNFRHPSPRKRVHMTEVYNVDLRPTSRNTAQILAHALFTWFQVQILVSHLCSNVIGSFSSMEPLTEDLCFLVLQQFMKLQLSMEKNAVFHLKGKNCAAWVTRKCTRCFVLVYHCM